MSKGAGTPILHKPIRRRTRKVSAEALLALSPAYLREVHADIFGLLDAPEELGRRLRWWISTQVSPASKPHPNYSGGMKHVCAAQCHCYLTADIFKAAMLLAGYLPVDPHAPYGWRWKMKVRNSGERCPGSEKFISCWPQAKDKEAANG